MEPIQIAEKLKEKFPEEVVSISEFREQVSVVVKKHRLLDICRFLHDDPECNMDYLRDLTAVDYPMRKGQPRFEVVYHLYSIKLRHMLRLKAFVPEDDCFIDSVTPIWIGADWHERECFDMFGITFNGHPDLRRILMPEDWQGHPLRKDYPLKGPGPKEEWKGLKEVFEKAKEFKEFQWEK